MRIHSGTRRKRILVLGGGIRGTAIAALLAQSQEFEVILIERQRIASGTTSTNHGRIHSGAGLWRAGVPELAKRHGMGGYLMRRFLARHSILQGPAMYAIEDPGVVLPFSEACDELAIDHRLLGDAETSLAKHLWRYVPSAIMELPESAFSPSEVARLLARQLVASGGRVLLGAEVTRVERSASHRLQVIIRGREIIETDIVVNALGNWSNTLASSQPLPRLDLRWYCWRLLCLRGLRLPHLYHSVLASIDSEGLAPAIIVHSDWAVLGCRTRPTPVRSPEVLDETVFRPFSEDSPADTELLRLLQKHFALAVNRDRLCTVTGVYPGLPTTYPNYSDSKETGFRIIFSEEMPGYYVVYGENATVAFVDAIEAVDVITQRHLPARTRRRMSGMALFVHLCCRRPDDPDARTGNGMIWTMA